MLGFSFIPVAYSVAKKTTAIRRIALRETSVCRHHGGPIEGIPPETSRTTTQHYRIEGFKGALY